VEVYIIITCKTGIKIHCTIFHLDEKDTRRDKDSSARKCKWNQGKLLIINEV
jgi:hypothetical protein